MSDYKGKDGAVYISFGADGKPISIQWISLPKTSDEYTELCNTLTSDLNKQYGDAYFTNETAEVTVWKDDSKAVTLFTINSNDSYTVSVNYAAKSAEEIPSGKSMSGYMVVKVPDGWNKVELQSRQGTFEINSSDFQ